jgi:hypothetical protein
MVVHDTELVRACFLKGRREGKKGRKIVDDRNMSY